MLKMYGDSVEGDTFYGKIISLEFIDNEDILVDT